MNAIGIPHQPQPPKPAWWVAPVCYLIVGAFDGAAVVLWFVRSHA